MDDKTIYNINHYIKYSQCIIKKLWENKYLLYDDFNEYNVKVYKTVEFITIINDIKAHLKRKIQDHLIPNTKKNIIEYFKEMHNIKLVFSKTELLVVFPNWEKKTLLIKDFDSPNVKLLKLELIEILWVYNAN